MSDHDRQTHGKFPSVSSIVDYLAQWLEARYGKP